MPDWILAPICIIILVGFIGYAFRQGTKVHPDSNNGNFGPTANESYSGLEGGSDSGGHSL